VSDHHRGSPPRPSELRRAVGVSDLALRLPDGRTLGYAQYGAPDGTPVVYHHGGLSCRQDIAFADARLRERGVLLLAPDRPGTGRSTRRPGMRIADVFADTRVLVDARGLERFALLGWSAGGPYTLACAHGFGTRVDAVATVGGAGPLETTELVSGLGLDADRVLFTLARFAPLLARLPLALARRVPARWISSRMAQGFDSPADRAAFAAMGPDEAHDWFIEAARHGTAGIVDDYRALICEWGFQLEDVGSPVILWQGAEDRIVPLQETRRLADRLPAAEVRIVPDAGHFLLREHLDAVLDGLLPNSS